MNIGAGTVGLQISQPAINSPVREQFDTAWSLIISLHDRVNNLSERLIPVINPRLLTPKNISEETTEPLLSPLGENLNQLCSSMMELREKLDSIMGRLDL